LKQKCSLIFNSFVVLLLPPNLTNFHTNKTTHNQGSLK